jgi:hypothetical protein
MELDFSPTGFRNIKFHENPSSERRVAACGQAEGATDMKLIDLVRNFANAPKMVDSHINCVCLKLQRL